MVDGPPGGIKKEPNNGSFSKNKSNAEQFPLIVQPIQTKALW
jgi:hypothetical protein